MKHCYALLPLACLLASGLARAQEPCTVAGQVTIVSPDTYAGVASAGWPSGDGSWADTTGLVPPGVTGTLIHVEDPGGDSLLASPGTGCVPLTNAAVVAGNIAFIRRGGCEFGLKALHAQQAGAIGFLIYNDRDEGDGEFPVIMGGGAFGHLVTIPGLFAHRNLGLYLLRAMEASGKPAVVNLSYAECWVSPIEPQPDGSSGTHALSAVSPNPSTGRAALALEVAETQRVRVALFDALGREVTTIHDGLLGAGAAHTLTLDGSVLPAGIYVVRVTGEKFSDTRSIAFVR